MPHIHVQYFSFSNSVGDRKMASSSQGQWRWLWVTFAVIMLDLTSIPEPYRQYVQNPMVQLGAGALAIYLLSILF